MESLENHPELDLNTRIADAENTFDTGIPSEDELILVLRPIYTEVCGDAGEGIFFGTILPAYTAKYGPAYGKAGLELLQILESLGQTKANELESQLNRIPLPTPEDFTPTAVEARRSQVIEEATRFLTDMRQLYAQNEQSPYDGIEALVLFGSVTQGGFRSDSDVDVIPITSSDNPNPGYVRKDGQHVSFLSIFESRMQAIGHPSDDQKLLPLSLLDREEETRHKFLSGHSYIVVSDIPDTQSRVADTIRARGAFVMEV